MNYYYGPMNGFDWGWTLLMGIVWLLFFGVIVYIAIRLFKEKEVNDKNGSNPIEIAKGRYAKGEITKEQFDQLKRDLK